MSDYINIIKQEIKQHNQTIKLATLAIEEGELYTLRPLKSKILALCNTLESSKDKNTKTLLPHIKDCIDNLDVLEQKILDLKGQLEEKVLSHNG